MRRFAESPLGQRHAPIVVLWERRWERIAPALAYPPEIRRVLYTANRRQDDNIHLAVYANPYAEPCLDVVAKLAGLWQDARAAHGLVINVAVASRVPEVASDSVSTLRAAVGATEGFLARWRVEWLSSDWDAWSQFQAANGNRFRMSLRSSWIAAP